MVLGVDLNRRDTKHIFVLQCSNCKNILGDTCTLVSAEVELGAVVVSQALNVKIEDSNFEVSNSGVDSGSAFHRVSCSACQEIVGRSYKATPRALDHIRDMYALFEDKLLSYPLSYDPEQTNIQHIPKTADVAHCRNDIIEELTNDIRAMQQMLIILSDRILRLESKCSKLNGTAIS
eukprot:jgi/Galph1/5476/GphlegSOOS_G4194.1